MENKSIFKIAVASEILQKGIDYFVAAIKEQFNVNLAVEIIDDQLVNQIEDYSSEVFDQYEIKTDELFPLAAELYDHDYNVLEKAIELENTDPLIVNHVLKDYVLANILDHQATLKEYAKNNQQESQFNFER